MRSLLLPALAAALLTGCAGIGAGEFYANPSAASPFEMCKTLASGAPDMDFANALRMELGRRGVAEENCPRIIRDRETGVTVGVVAGVAAIAIAASKHSDVSVGAGVTIGAGSATVPGAISRHYAWDQFLNSAGSSTWACRGVESGEMVDPAYCASQPMQDNTWPGLGAPAR